MTTFLTFALLLAGANGEEDAGRFQFQYTPAFLLQGDHYSSYGGYFDALTFFNTFYFSHSLKGKVREVKGEGGDLYMVGGLANSIIPNAESKIRLADSGGVWLHSQTTWVSGEATLGVEWWRPGRCCCAGGSNLFGGAEVIAGIMGGKNETLSTISWVAGTQGYFGSGIPLGFITYKNFDVELRPTFKLGLVRELLTSPKVEGQKLRILPKFGIALGLSFNRKGGQK